MDKKIFCESPVRPTLPPLNALKTFEAAARHGSFVKAARDLGVTPPAVSQQVQILEAYLGRQLFHRRKNRISLTDAGLAIVPALTDGFDRIAEVARLAAGANVRSRVVVSALPSVAAKWLTGLLGAFAGVEPNVKIDLRLEEDPVEFARHDIDLRLSYGAHLYPDLVIEPLCKDRVVPLCAPSFFADPSRPAEPGSLADHDLIHTDWGPAFASHPTWSDWFDVAGIKRRPKAGPKAGANAGEGHRVGLSSLALDFAAEGMGVALGQSLLARRDLEEGRLISPFGPSLPLRPAYCLAYPREKARRAKVQALVAWLKDRVVE